MFFDRPDSGGDIMEANGEWQKVSLRAVSSLLLCCTGSGSSYGELPLLVLQRHANSMPSTVQLQIRRFKLQWY